jgi:hypothetical protein
MGSPNFPIYAGFLLPSVLLVYSVPVINGIVNQSILTGDQNVPSVSTEAVGFLYSML